MAGLLHREKSFFVRMTKMFVPIEWLADGKVRFLDQTRLPQEESWVETADYERIADAIRRLEVRGAPLIGIAAAYGLALAARASIGDAAAIGKVVIPAMEMRGYPRALSAAIVSNAASAAILIPPSIPMIIYAWMAEVSVAKMFFAYGIGVGVWDVAMNVEGDGAHRFLPARHLFMEPDGLSLSATRLSDRLDRLSLRIAREAGIPAEIVEPVDGRGSVGDRQGYLPTLAPAATSPTIPAPSRQ